MPPAVEVRSLNLWDAREVPDDVILYVESLKIPQKTLQLINKFNKVARYKINMQKTVEFLYTNNNLKRKLRQFHLQ